MSIFSPFSSSITAFARAPTGPINAPFGLTPARCDRTETLLLNPGSRDTPTISTIRSFSSGTSNVKSALTNNGCVLESVTSGPFRPCLTSTTKHLMRWPCT